jgi:hypothetical protein
MPVVWALSGEEAVLFVGSDALHTMSATSATIAASPPIHGRILFVGLKSRIWKRLAHGGNPACRRLFLSPAPL